MNKINSAIKFSSYSPNGNGHLAVTKVQTNNGTALTLEQLKCVAVDSKVVFNVGNTLTWVNAKDVLLRRLKNKDCEKVVYVKNANGENVAMREFNVATIDPVKYADDMVAAEVRNITGNVGLDLEEGEEPNIGRRQRQINEYRARCEQSNVGHEADPIYTPRDIIMGENEIWMSFDKEINNDS